MLPLLQTKSSDFGLRSLIFDALTIFIRYKRRDPRDSGCRGAGSVPENSMYLGLAHCPVRVLKALLPAYASSSILEEEEVLEINYKEC